MAERKNLYDTSHDRVIIPSSIWFNIVERLATDGEKMLPVRIYIEKEIQNEDDGIDEYITRICVEKNGAEIDI